MTLTDIIGYLPHGLVGVSTTGDITEVNIAYMAWHGVNSMGHKLVLRPMTDLATEITEKGYNGGKPFVPIVELAKISRPETIISPKRVIRETSKFIEIINDGDVLAWDQIQRRFYLDSGSEYGPSQGLLISVPDGHRFYDLLHQWHFDYRGLIEQGDAVNVYDLEKNPYEN